MSCHVSLSIGLLTTWKLALLRAWGARGWGGKEREREKLQCLLKSNLRRGILLFLPYSFGHTDQLWYTVRENHARLWTPGDRDHGAILEDGHHTESPGEHSTPQCTTFIAKRKDDVMHDTFSSFVFLILHFRKLCELYVACIFFFSKIQLTLLSHS